MPHWLDNILQEIRYAARGLARRPGFSAVGALCLAIGIGANSVMFGVVDELLLRPPAGVRDPGSLAWVSLQVTGTDERAGFSYRDYLDFTRVSAALHISAYTAGGGSLGRGTQAREVRFLVVTHEFMPMLGVAPALGREFSAADDTPGAAPVVMLAYDFWKSEFGGDVDVIGRMVRLNAAMYTVVGIAPPGFNGVERSRVDLFVPPSYFANERPQGAPFTNRNFHWASVLARLDPGMRRERLAAELNAVYHAADPGNKDRADWTVIAAAPTSMVAMAHRQVQDVEVALWLYGVAAVVLLIACANVASLLLIRASGRQREIAVRVALGISGLRLARLLMTESALLAGVGSMAGLALAALASGVFRATLVGVDIGSGLVDLRVVSATLVATIFTGFICGLAPALVATRPDLGSVLKSGDRVGSHGRGRVNSVLLVGQVALTLVLLVGAALFVRSLQNLDNLDLGFDAPHLLRARLAAGIPTSEANRYFGEVLRRVSALPGAQRAALATGGPFAAMRGYPLAIPGLPPIEPARSPMLDGVTPEYFGTLGMTLINGRNFTTADENTGGVRVVIVNDVMARRYWPSGDALGRCIQVGGDTMPCRTIVGIVHAAQQGNMPGQPVETEQALDAYYLPFDLEDRMLFGGTADAWLWVRSAGNATQLVPAVRRIVETLAPDSPYPDVVAISTRLADEFRPWQLGAMMCGIFGGAAFMLALVGLYGVLAFRVSQRTHEIGVRIALGAQRDDVRRLVVGHGLHLAAIGVGIGVGASLACARLLEPLLYRTSASDPLILTLTGGALLAVAIFASYVPALRATRIDPVEALRQL